MSWFGLDKLGDTSFWGGFSNIHNGIGAGSNGDGGNLGQYLLTDILGLARLPTSRYQRKSLEPMSIAGLSLSIRQSIRRACIYAVYQHFTPDVDLVTRDTAVSPKGKLKDVAAPLDDFDLFYTGGRIYF